MKDGELGDSGQEELELDVEEIAASLDDGESEFCEPVADEPLSV